MIFTRHIKEHNVLHIKLWYLTDAGPNKTKRKKQYQKIGEKRNNNANVSNVIYWRTFFLQKYTREHDKHESTPKLNCAGDVTEKNPSAPNLLFFSGIVRA